jgi:polynucleotide 5'-kinase involved in rRNA processing
MNYIEVLDRINLPKVPGEEKGLLVGLKNSRQRFIGIGVVTEVNRNKKVLKVFTPVKSKPGCIIIGKLKLDENLKEA